jgi:hypothetical protein
MSGNQVKIEPLTSEDINLLNQDLGVTSLALKWGPLVIVIAVWWFLWYFDRWFWLIPSSLALLMIFYGYIAVILQSRNIRKDLESKIKIVDTFYAEDKFILGYKKRTVSNDSPFKHVQSETKITLDKDLLERLANYQKAKESNSLLFLERDFQYDEMLRYKFVLNLRNAKGQTEKFYVSIEDFITCPEKENVKVWYAKHSKKVFQVK